jgi:hypothetical protein
MPDSGRQPRQDLVGARLEALEQRSPACGPEAIGARQPESAPRYVQAGQRFADRRAMARLRAPDPHALQERHQGRGPPGQHAQHSPLCVAHGRRAVEPGLGQVLHEAQKKGQIGRVDSLLVEREEDWPSLCVQQIVGILYALRDTLVGQERPHVVGRNEGGQLFV